MKEYVAVVKRDPDTELQHWKYIKREKKNGKWRYIYNDSELKKYDKHVEETTDTGKTIVYSKHAKLFDGELQVGNDITIYKQGDLSRAVAKGEKWVYDNILSESINQKRINNINKHVEKGKKKFESLLKKMTLKQTANDSKSPSKKLKEPGQNVVKRVASKATIKDLKNRR